MIDTQTHRQHDQKENRLFVLFAAPQQFLANPVRSLLKYFESNSIFSLVGYNPNLYTASSCLVNDYQPINYQWQLPDGKVEPVSISIIAQADSAYLLCWDLGTSNTAEYLIGSQATPAIAKKLGEMLRAGSYMSNSKVAALTYESSPNQDIQLNIVDEIYFSLSKLPIILSSRFCLSPSVTCIGYDDSALFSTDNNPVFTPRQLPLALSTSQTDFSIWLDESTASYYKIDNSTVFSVGDRLLRNCFSSSTKQVEAIELEPYAITDEAASHYLEAEFKESFDSAVTLIGDWIGDRTTANSIEQTKELNSTLLKVDWIEVFQECLGVSELQIEQNPKLLEERIKEFLTHVQNLITDDKSVSQAAKTSARQTLDRIQSVLSSHNPELADSVGQLADNLPQLSLPGDLSARSPNSELLKVTTFFSSLDLTDEGIETITNKIISQYQELWNDDSLNLLKQDRLSEDLRTSEDIVREVEQQYPLPTFSFEDLLAGDD